MTALVCGASCGASNAEIRTARNARYETDRTTAYQQTLIAVSKLYSKVEGNSKKGVIQTAWHHVSGTSAPIKSDRSESVFYARFRVEIAGSSPLSVRVTGEASERSPGLHTVPLAKAEEPGWLKGRTDALQLAIYQRLKKYAVGATTMPVSVAVSTTETEGSESPLPQADTSPATVHVRTSATGIVVAARSEGGDIVGPDGSRWQKVCVAPCSFRIKPGPQQVMIEGSSHPTKLKLNMRPGETAYLVAKPTSPRMLNGGAILALTGLTAMVVGTVAMALTDLELKWTVGTAMGGLGGVGLGVALIGLSDSDLDIESAPKGPLVSKGISLSGAF